MSWISPAPGAKEGRTDQGVDWSPVQRLVAVAGGVISNIYYNIGWGTGPLIVEKIKNRYVYYAEEVGGSTNVHTGETVKQGETIAGPSGSVEVGFWNPATGHAQGYVPGKTSGAPTAAGRQFHSMISNTRGGSNNPNQQITLSQLWIQAGGSPKLANLMAAIAMAESGGDTTNVNGSTQATGLWQIIPTTWATYAGGLPFSDATNPADNAKVAVAVYKGQGLGAWQSYTNGSYKKYLGSASKFKISYGGPNGGRVRPGGSGQPSGQGVDTAIQNYIALRDMDRTDPQPATLTQSSQWFFDRFTQKLGSVVPGG